MFHDILHLIRTKEVLTEINESYSVLTCRKCGSKQEILGSVVIEKLSNGWTALSLDTKGNDSIFKWLLCPDCSNLVRIAAGLK